MGTVAGGPIFSLSDTSLFFSNRRFDNAYVNNGLVINVPHVVLRGNVKVKEMFEKLEPIFVKNEKEILRTANIYIDRDGKSILIESLAIEGAKKTQFLCMISAREDGIVVRVYPGFEVKKTNGVKRILVEVSHQLTKKIPQLTVGETNLSEYFT